MSTYPAQEVLPLGNVMTFQEVDDWLQQPLDAVHLLQETVKTRTSEIFLCSKI